MGSMSLSGPVAPAGHRIKKEYSHLPGQARMLGVMFHGKGAKGPIGNMFERIPQTNYDTGPAWDYTPPSTMNNQSYTMPEIRNTPYQSKLSDWESNTSVPQYDSSFRDSMRMNIPAPRQGVSGIFNKNLKGAVKKNRAPSAGGSSPFNRAGNQGLNV
tara:strand:- start:885 stop:1355 length:471 start_codon:yes stop_codon:yes gene_type:complete